MNTTPVRYALADSSLGSVLVAATDRGICAVFLGDDPAALAADLRRRFPAAEPGLADRVADVVRLVESPAVAPALPLDLRGTAFQRQVWDALTRIPPGETATYAAIAERIGRPTAARAVGLACGANPVAVAVPCHRVVGSSGALTGYRWGVARKAALLARERTGERGREPGAISSGRVPA